MSQQRAERDLGGPRRAPYGTISSRVAEYNRDVADSQKREQDVTDAKKESARQSTEAKSLEDFRKKDQKSWEKSFHEKYDKYQNLEHSSKK